MLASGNADDTGGLCPPYATIGKQLGAGHRDGPFNPIQAFSGLDMPEKSAMVLFRLVKGRVNLLPREVEY